MLLSILWCTGADAGAARAEALESSTDLSEELGGTKRTYTDNVLLRHVLEHPFMYCFQGRLDNRSFKGSCRRGSQIALAVFNGFIPRGSCPG